jgi:hypothetical protein
VAPEPAPPGPRRDTDPARGGGDPGDPRFDRTGRWRPLPPGADWMDDAAWEARRASLAGAEDPDPDLDLEEDPDCGPPPGLDDAQLAAMVAEARELSAGEARAAVRAARLGTTGALAAIAADRRGPGMAGSAKTFPGELAADQRVTWWAQQLKAAGLGGGMDELRARAYLDILLGTDSRPPAGGTGRDGGTGDGLVPKEIRIENRTRGGTPARKHRSIISPFQLRAAAPSVCRTSELRSS